MAREFRVSLKGWPGAPATSRAPVGGDWRPVYVGCASVRRKRLSALAPGEKLACGGERFGKSRAHRLHTFREGAEEA